MSSKQMGQRIGKRPFSISGTSDTRKVKMAATSRTQVTSSLKCRNWSAHISADNQVPVRVRETTVKLPSVGDESSGSIHYVLQFLSCGLRRTYQQAVGVVEIAAVRRIGDCFYTGTRKSTSSSFTSSLPHTYTNWTRNSVVGDKPRDALVQMQWRD